MAAYTFTNKHKDLSPEKIWKLIQDGLSKNIIIKSINKEIHYNINYITENEISFSAESRNAGKPEIITIEDFVAIIPGLKNMVTFNTSTSKAVFKESKIYKKRSPMFALLVSSEVIEKIIKILS